MQRQPVESKSLRSIGYNTEKQTLEVEFDVGGIYQFFDVPPDLHTKLMSVSPPEISPLFTDQIKGHYRYARRI